MKILKTKINFEDKRGYIKDLIENENINSVTLIKVVCEQIIIINIQYNTITY